MPRFMAIVKHPQTHAGAVVFILWAFMMFATRHVYPLQGDILTVRPWWDYISSHGFSGIATIGEDTGADVTPIWYFIMYLYSALHIYPQLSLEYCIKSIAVVFDIAGAVATWMILKRVSSSGSWRPLMASGLILFLPSFLADVLKTNLPDSPYLALCLMSLVAYQRKKHWLTWLFVGLGAAFKMMAIFVIPFYLFLYLREFKAASWKERIAPVFAFIGFVVCSIPSMLAGQGFYAATVGWVLPRVKTNLDFGIWNILNGQNWQWFPGIHPGQVLNLSLFGYACIVLVFFVVYRLLFSIGEKEAQARASLDLLVLSPLVCWFFLPSQRESYFTMAALFAMIALMVQPDRGRLVVFLMTNAILWEGFHGLYRVLGSQQAYVYLLMGVAGYLIWRIWRLSELHSELAKDVVLMKLLQPLRVDDDGRSAQDAVAVHDAQQVGGVDDPGGLDASTAGSITR